MKQPDYPTNHDPFLIGLGCCVVSAIGAGVLLFAGLLLIGVAEVLLWAW